jgi:acetyl-CoA synthetase
VRELISSASLSSTEERNQTSDTGTSPSLLPTTTRILPVNRYHDLHKDSLENIERFWEKIASEEISWYKSWDKVLDWSPPFARWFVGAQLNASYNCIDRHLQSEKRNKVAYYWEGENDERRAVTYQDLYHEVTKLANALKTFGAEKGDKVTIYLPMTPELPIAMLACARLGAPFNVVFSGFSSQSLSDRINNSASSLLITADGGYRRGKIVPLKHIADQALATSPSVHTVIVYKRTGHDVSMKEERDYWWSDVVTDAKVVPPVPVESNHPLYLLYSSGTTGKDRKSVV